MRLKRLSFPTACSMRPRFGEYFGEERGSVGRVRLVGNDRTDATLARAIAIYFRIVSLVGDGGARRDVGADIEEKLEIVAVGGFAAGQMKGERQDVAIDLEGGFRGG